MSGAGTSGAPGTSTTTATGTGAAMGTGTGTSTATGTGAVAGTGTGAKTATVTGTATSTPTSTGTGNGTGMTSGAGTGTATGTTASTDAGSSALPGWVLTWSDEFDGPDGSAVDPTKWTHDVGGTGWGNEELEYYTDGTQNAVVQGGNLVITATTQGASSLSCSYPSNGACEYTSARLKTQGLFSQQYGRFEARIQIPEGQGLWPAFWMLGANIDTASWPDCGEIDIMENVGKEPAENHGSLHMPAAGTTNDDDLTGQYSLTTGKLGDDFHTYAVEWSSAAIRFYVDDQLYETQTPATATGRTWEFDAPFFILLNVAVGGAFPGSPDSSTMFPQTMKVDWVRVYQPADGG
jgi:beta-glucanase (GH16 family)